MRERSHADGGWQDPRRPLPVVGAADEYPPPHKWPAASLLIKAGVPLEVAVRYKAVRAQMSPKGLQRRMREVRN